MDSVELRSIAKEFPVDLKSTRRLKAGGLGDSIRLYRVGGSDLVPADAYTGDTYIVDTEPGRMVACHPHIVGEELRALCTEAARGFVAASTGLRAMKPDETAVMHILRAGTGYMVAEAMPIHVPIVDVRTQYVEDGYRDHSDDPRSLRVSYRKYPKRLEEAGTMVIPDTYATGRSAEAAVNDLLANGFKPDTVIIYGFVAAPALARLGALCEAQGMKLKCFAICDLSQLAHNNYDMPVYGLDEGLHAATGEERRLGSVVAPDTLKAVLQSYIPGMDQPGDWSERQSRLYTGLKREQGDIRGHLEKSIRLIERLRGLSRGSAWFTAAHEEAAERELEALRRTLARYR